jgi:hypothetical protein
MGFPWTVQNWDKYKKKQQTSKNSSKLESAG